MKATYRVTLLAGATFLFLANHATAYQFSFTITGAFSASGTLTTGPLTGSPLHYVITAISGTQAGVAMTLLAPGTFGTSSHNLNDNALYPGSNPLFPLLDIDGLSFEAGGVSYNVYDAFPGPIYGVVSSSGSSGIVTFTVTPTPLSPFATPFTTYTYQGNAYNTCSGTYCTGGPYSLSAEFTTTLGNAVTYSYQSPTFTNFIGNTGLSTSSFVSASVTYNNPLASNLNDCKGSSGGCTTTGNLLADVPSSWVFSDGVRQWTPANSHFYVAVVDTNAAGNIVEWDFTLYTNPGFMDPEIYTISCAGNLGCDEVVLSDATLGANTNVYAYGPGSQTAWTQGAALSSLSYADITSSIVSFSITDGSGLTIDNNNASYKDFHISTEASGGITKWLIQTCGSSCNIQMQTNWLSPTSFSPGADFSETTAGFAGSYGLISNDPGIWTASPLAALTATQIATTASGLLYSRVTRTYNGTLTITNISDTALSGPFPVVLTSLTPGVTLTNASGFVQGGPFINPGVSSLSPGQSVSVQLQFSNPSNALIHFTPIVY